MRFYYSILLLGLILLPGCTRYQSKFDRKYPSYTKDINTRTTIPQLNDSTLSIPSVSHDEQYGRTPAKPIMLGMADRETGAQNIGKYLNALTGENGEEVYYRQLSPCCPFKTVNGANEKYFKSEYGLLERYKVFHSALDDTITLYLNLYDAGMIQAPKGFGIRK